MINRVWYLVADLKATTKQLHEYIWGDRLLDKNIKNNFWVKILSIIIH